ELQHARHRGSRSPERHLPVRKRLRPRRGGAMITDLLGNRIPSGRIVRQLTADFLTGSRPTWLAVASGTESFGGETTERYYQLATADTLGSTAKLTLPTLQSDKFTGLFLTLEGLHFDEDDAISFHFGFNAR